VATLVTEQGIVHYEVYGRGRPVLLLHGWLNSWALWRNTIELLGRDFRMYALDFLGFGESGAQAESFTVDNFVLLVDQFMDRMGIVKAPLIGHSMGGTVSLKTAIQFPEKVVKVGVVGSPIIGTSLSPLLKMAAYRGWVDLAENSPAFYNIFQSGFRPFLRGYSYFLARDGKRLGDMLSSDASKLSFMPFFESIGTLRETDLRPQLHKIEVPVLGIYGKRDAIVDPEQYKVLKEFLPHSQIDWFAQSGHFPMLDETDRFHESIRTFLNKTS
jgi:pimeloyl-ACP methyl ester carboxylesterase